MGMSRVRPSTVVFALLWVLILCVIFSPHIAYQLLERSFSSYVTQKATPRDCALVRRGRAHEDGIICTLDYTVDGKAVSVKAMAWESGSAFNTQAFLHRRLAAFDRGQPIDIDISELRGAGRPRYVPQEWFLAPAWALDALVLIGLFAAVLYVCSSLSGAARHRADYDYDEHGELVRKRFNGAWREWPSQFLLWLLWCLLLLVMFYTVANRPANHRLLLGRTLVQAPAILTHCAAHYTGGQKGHDEIECDLSYWWQGRKLRGQAEAVDFRWFPTDARLDSAVDAAEGRRVSAYVDPAQPGYAIAFINDDIFLPYSMGLSDIMLVCAFCAVTIWAARVSFARLR
jgi:hypothetical protein